MPDLCPTCGAYWKCGCERMPSWMVHYDVGGAAFFDDQLTITSTDLSGGVFTEPVVFAHYPDGSIDEEVTAWLQQRIGKEPA